MTGTHRIRIWDLPTRLFHWLFVLALVAAWAVADLEPEIPGYGETDLPEHMLIGYGVLVLLLFRIIWGFVGSETARFSRFVRGPKAAFEHVRALRRGEPHPAGHNPLGGWMVVALLVVTAVQAGSGLFAADDIWTSAILADEVSDSTQEFLDGIHHQAFDVLVILAGLHILAVLAHKWIGRENLVPAMVTGRRAVPADWRQPRMVSPWRAVVVLAVSVGAVYALVAVYG